MLYPCSYWSSYKIQTKPRRIAKEFAIQKGWVQYLNTSICLPVSNQGWLSYWVSNHLYCFFFNITDSYACSMDIWSCTLYFYDVQFTAIPKLISRMLGGTNPLDSCDFSLKSTHLSMNTNHDCRSKRGYVIWTKIFPSSLESCLQAVYLRLATGHEKLGRFLAHRVVVASQSSVLLQESRLYGMSWENKKHTNHFIGIWYEQYGDILLEI
jgi:hypothetical protein